MCIRDRFLSTVEKASSDKIVMSLSRPLDQRVLTTLLARLEKLGKIHREFENTVVFTRV